MDKTKNKLPKTKKTRMFAPFRNKQDMNDRMNDMLDDMTKKNKHDVWLWVGQYESTLAEGFADEKE